jgi:hypothetical protein
MSGQDDPEGKRFTTRPYRVEYPDSSERAQSVRSLEDALSAARWLLYRVWRETGEWGVEGGYCSDIERAVITNRHTGYRWILRRHDHRVEFQTPQMLDELVAREYVDLHMTIEEAEALATAACAAPLRDRRTKDVADQALEQIAYACGSVRARVRGADEYYDWARGIQPRPPDEPPVEDEPPEDVDEATPAEPPQPAYVSLKGAAKIIGKAPSTLYKWHREGKFPPAVDVTDADRRYGGPTVIVPLDRLEAWRNGEEMRPWVTQVFETYGLREPPWVAFTVKPGVKRADVAYWVERRSLKAAFTKDGKRIYGFELDEAKRYEVFEQSR